MRKKIIGSILCIFMMISIFMVEMPNDANPQVTEEWIVRYDGGVNTSYFVEAMAVDSFGNVFVTGYNHGNITAGDYVTVAYDTNGNLLWSARYTDPVNNDDTPRAISVDESTGNVYVTGRSRISNSRFDIATVAYDSSGTQLWVAKHNGPANGDDGAYAMALDSTGNIYVTGRSAGIGTNYDYITLKYNVNGTQLWNARYNGPGNMYDSSHAVVVNSSGMVYVTGRSDGSGTNKDYATIAYNSSGNELWVARYNGPGNGRDIAKAIALDSSENILVTGGSKGNGTDFDSVTIKYDKNGTCLWVKRYHGPSNGIDIFDVIAINSSGTIYVTGGSEGNGTNFDYSTIAYDSTGNELWVVRYNGPGNGYDYSRDIVIDPLGNIYITGESEGNGTSKDYATIKYDSSGNMLWIQRYNSIRNESDSAFHIGLDAYGYIYVTGNSPGLGTSIYWARYDYCTIKYSQQNQTSIVTIDIDPDTLNLKSKG
ncbi:MAG: SBBP repeat-containing protein, partial [Thermoplasmata archaeon]|nr:SBBP repeat-containing protein [Thermoplasmata archaeon]